MDDESVPVVQQNLYSSFMCEILKENIICFDFVKDKVVLWRLKLTCFVLCRAEQHDFVHNS